MSTSPEPKSPIEEKIDSPLSVEGEKPPSPIAAIQPQDHATQQRSTESYNQLKEMESKLEKVGAYLLVILKEGNI